MSGEPEEPFRLPITDELDLHTFRPRDVGPLVEDWVEEAWQAGFRLLRIIHGKGSGQLREKVHSVLRKHPRVLDFRLGGDRGGGWGATVVRLRE